MQKLTNNNKDLKILDVECGYKSLKKLIEGCFSQYIDVNIDRGNLICKKG